jgi:adenylate kinase
MPDERPHHLIVFGAPGAGKGTQAVRLSERLGLAHLNPGSMFREVAAEDSSRGHELRELMAGGELVPDDVTDKLVRERLEALSADQGFVLDGYPRNVAQAEALHGLLADLGRLEPRPVVLRLDVPREELMQRLRRRRDVEDRPDDTEEGIRRRLEVYADETAPVLAALDDWADVLTIHGDQPPEAVAEEMLDRLDGAA